MTFAATRAGSRDDVPAAPIFDAWCLEPLSTDAFPALGPDAATSGPLSSAQLRHLAAFGLLAPTTHNTVPQRFRLPASGGDTLELWADRRFILRESDPVGRQACVSLGCVLANIEAAAGYYGLATRLEVCDSADILPELETQPRYVHVANLRFSSSTEVPPVVCPPAVMLHRKVVRALYDDALRLDPALVDGLRAAVADRYPSLEVRVLTDRPDLFRLGKLQELADRTVFERRAFLRELGAWLIANDDQERPRAMRGREFGFDDAFAAALSRGLRQEERLLPDQVAALARGGKLGFESASAALIIGVTDDRTSGWFDAGRAYEELALRLTEAGLTTAVHAALTEVEVPNRMLRAQLGMRARPAVVFRVGTPKRLDDGARPHSARPALDQVVLPTALGPVDGRPCR